MYIEMTLEDAMKLCKRNQRVLISVRDLALPTVNEKFEKKERNEYQEIFSGMKTAASMTDDFVKQLQLFSEEQDIYNLKPIGIQKIILLRE